MLIIIAIVIVILAVIASGFMAPVLMAKNKKILAQMIAEIADHQTMAPGYRESHRTDLISRLIVLKKKMYVGDKASMAEAQDLLNSSYLRG